MKKIVSLVAGIVLVSSIVFAQEAMYYRIDSLEVKNKGKILLNVTFIQGTTEIPANYNLSGNSIDSFSYFLNREAYMRLNQKKNIESKLPNLKIGQKILVTPPVTPQPIAVNITKDVAAGQKVIEVDDTSNLWVGMEIRIIGNEKKELGGISAIEKNKAIILKDPLNYNYTVSEEAKIQR